MQDAYLMVKFILDDTNKQKIEMKIIEKKVNFDNYFDFKAVALYTVKHGQYNYCRC